MIPSWFLQKCLLILSSVLSKENHISQQFLLYSIVCCLLNLLLPTSLVALNLTTTPLQKVQQVLLWFPATIPAPHELPGSGLSENIKIKKIYRGTLTSEFSKTSFYIEIQVV